MKAAFIDRDGTIIAEWARSPDAVRLLSGALEGLQRLQRNGFLLFLMSNQADVGRGRMDLETANAIHERFVELLDGVRFERFYYCFHTPEDRCMCRKPEPGFIARTQRDYKIDLSRSWMIGDRATDIECGRLAGLQTYRVTPQCTLAHIAAYIEEYE